MRNKSSEMKPNSEPVEQAEPLPEDITPKRRFPRFAISGRAMARALAELTGTASRDVAVRVHPELPDEDVDLMAQRIQDCLAGKGGAVTARASAADLGRAYLKLSLEGRARFFALLLDRFGPDLELMKTAARQLASVGSDDDLDGALAHMRRALSSPRIELFKQFNSLEEGIKFLVDMRADLLSLADDNPALRTISDELRDLLASWFDIGFLDLRQITWDAPAALLEKLVSYEAVHEITSWDDMKNRLDSDRRCYAFFHPSMPSEPLIFVEVALVNGMAGNVQALLDHHAPVDDPENADTAIFYSISNAQAGLAGVAFGNFLIKRVVDVLSHELPNLKAFATLSPIPGFRRWLNKVIGGPPPLLNATEAQAIGALTGTREPAQALLAFLDNKEWQKDEIAASVLQPILMRLCARYLVNERRPSTPADRVRDPVGHFHLLNGARVERLNWMADISENGLKQSAGMMVNYRYLLNDIDTNHERYKGSGQVMTSSAVRSLL